MAVSITKAQAAWLKAAAAHHNIGSGSVLNRTANALCDKGLARRYHDSRGLGTWLLTEAGKAAANAPTPAPETPSSPIGS